MVGGGGEVPAEPSKAMQMTLPKRLTERMCRPVSDSSGGVTVFRATGERTVAPATTRPVSASRSRSFVTSSSGSSGTGEDRTRPADGQTLRPVVQDLSEHNGRAVRMPPLGGTRNRPESPPPAGILLLCIDLNLTCQFPAPSTPRWHSRIGTSRSASDQSPRVSLTCQTVLSTMEATRGTADARACRSRCPRRRFAEDLFR